MRNDRKDGGFKHTCGGISKHLRYPSGEHFLYHLSHQLNHLVELFLAGTAVAVAIGAHSLPTNRTRDSYQGNHKEENSYAKHSS